MGEREHYNEMWNLASNYLANSADFGPAKLAQLGCFTAQGHSEVGFSQQTAKAWRAQTTSIAFLRVGPFCFGTYSYTLPESTLSVGLVFSHIFLQFLESVAMFGATGPVPQYVGGI